MYITTENNTHRKEALDAFETIRNIITRNEKIMIIEDSFNTYENTLEVLNIYSNLVTTGNYFIVEDSICHRGLEMGPEPGPYEGIQQFIKSNANFIVDKNMEGNLITLIPNGYLKRIK